MHSSSKRAMRQSVVLLICMLCSVLEVKVVADYIPQARLDGFVYRNQHHPDSILIEAFFDPLCPDSRDSWSPFKQAMTHYGSRVSLAINLLPLPYHDNAFLASRALHVVNALNKSATFPMLEWLFKHQEKFYGARTKNFSRASIENEMVKFVTKVVGKSYYSSIKSGFNDRKTDLQTRVSFKILLSLCHQGLMNIGYDIACGCVLGDQSHKNSDTVDAYALYCSWLRPLFKSTIEISHFFSRFFPACSMGNSQ